MNIAIILAGGVGNRVGATDKFGERIPKQFVEVLGKPVLVYTIEKFQEHPDIDAIEVVCVESHINYMVQLKNKYSLDKVKWIVKGGATFQESVYNGVNNLRQKIDDEDIVLIHFGASPFVEKEIISDAINVCKIHGNAISTTDYFVLSGRKAKSTSVEDPENYSNEYINRESIACMSTPHAFKYDFIKDLYDEAIRKNIINKVEPHTTTLMYALKKPIYFSKGSQTNIKITKKEDLELFEGYVLMKRRKKSEC